MQAKPPERPMSGTRFSRRRHGSVAMDADATAAGEAEDEVVLQDDMVMSPGGATCNAAALGTFTPQPPASKRPSEPPLFTPQPPAVPSVEAPHRRPVRNRAREEAKRRSGGADAPPAAWEATPSSVLDVPETPGTTPSLTVEVASPSSRPTPSAPAHARSSSGFKRPPRLQLCTSPDGPALAPSPGPLTRSKRAAELALAEAEAAASPNKRRTTPRAQAALRSPAVPSPSNAAAPPAAPPPAAVAAAAPGLYDSIPPPMHVTHAGAGGGETPQFPWTTNSSGLTPHLTDMKLLSPKPPPPAGSRGRRVWGDNSEEGSLFSSIYSSVRSSQATQASQAAASVSGSQSDGRVRLGTSAAGSSFSDFVVRGSASTTASGEGAFRGSAERSQEGAHASGSGEFRPRRSSKAAAPPAIQRIRRRQKQQAIARQLATEMRVRTLWAAARAATAVVRLLHSVRAASPTARARGGGGGKAAVPNARYADLRSSVESLVGAGKAREAITLREQRERTVPYAMQVNMEYYSDEALAVRHSLRRDPEVVAALGTWWKDLPKSIFGGINKQTYLALSLSLNKALNGHYKYLEALGSAEQDWREDAKGKKEMNREMLADALYELADLWCEGLGAKEYVAFLDQLLLAVTTKKDGKTQLRPLARTFYMNRPAGRTKLILAKVKRKVWAASAAMGRPPATRDTSEAGRLGLSCPDVRSMLRTAVSVDAVVPGSSKSQGDAAADHHLLEESAAAGLMFPPVRGATASDDGEDEAAAGPRSGGSAGGPGADWESSVPQLPNVTAAKFQAVAAKRAAAQRASVLRLRQSTGKIHKRGKAGAGGGGLTSPKPRGGGSKTRSKEWAELKAQVAAEDAQRREGYAKECFDRDRVLTFHTEGPCTSGISPESSKRYNLRRSVG